jgi:hypothetical protein
MLPTHTIAHEPSLTCTRCGHEVAYGTRFLSCLVGEPAPAPIGGAR